MSQTETSTKETLWDKKIRWNPTDGNHPIQRNLFYPGIYRMHNDKLCTVIGWVYPKHEDVAINPVITHLAQMPDNLEYFHIQIDKKYTLFYSPSNKEQELPTDASRLILYQIWNAPHLYLTPMETFNEWVEVDGERIARFLRINQG